MLVQIFDAGEKVIDRLLHRHHLPGHALLRHTKNCGFTLLNHLLNGFGGVIGDLSDIACRVQHTPPQSHVFDQMPIGFDIKRRRHRGHNLGEIAFAAHFF